MVVLLKNNVFFSFYYVNRMKIKLIEDDKVHGVDMEIPEYIESYILFENTRKMFSDVYNDTNSKYVVTLYTNTNTYMNFLAPHTFNDIMFNNDDIMFGDYHNGYRLLNEKLFIKGVVRKLPKDVKLIVEEELPLDPPYHTIKTYQNECTIPNDEVCDIIVKFIKDISLYKSHDKITHETIKAQKRKTIERLNESMKNAQIPIKKKLLNLKETFKERQTILKYSINETFVLSIIGALLLIFITVQWWYS